MSTYAIGDVQGCFSTLEKLLRKIQFDPNHDSLWFTGDLVNRGPESLETLRFIKQLGTRHVIVLGNHDLHLLAVAHDAHSGWPDDTLTPILEAPDRHELIGWLCQQPLLHHDATLGFTMVHAGIAPSWDLVKAKSLAHEVESVLRSDLRTQFFHKMYGNEPDQWDDELRHFDRLRCITNYLTRVRFCYADGRMDFKSKEKMGAHSSELIPWFQVPNRKMVNEKIIFGHWAALGGVTDTENVFALDTGCVWGYRLTAMCLENGERVSVELERLPLQGEDGRRPDGGI